MRWGTILSVFALLIALAPDANAQTYDVTLYVDNQDPQAADGNAGTQDQPLLTIQEAIDRAIQNKRDLASTRIVIEPGTYRELVDVQTYTNMTNGTNDNSNTTPILVEAADPGTVTISGSDVFTDWQQEGEFYWHTWTKDWGPAENPWAGNRDLDEITLRREMVFVDGQWMRQVLSASETSDGTFYVDESQDRIYVDPPAGVDFESALKEVAVRERTWFQQYENNFTIRGITFQHAAEPWSDIGGSARFVGAFNLVVEDCDFLWNNFLGFQLVDLNGGTLRRGTLNHNGADGWGIFQVQDILLEDTETSYNNWRGHLSGFHSWSIGNKILSAHGLTIRRHVARENKSRGLWIDYDNEDVLLEELVVEDNLLDGMWLEANQGPLTIRNSTIRGNQAAGIRSSYSENITLEGNLITENATNQLQLISTGGRDVRNFETGENMTLYLENWTLEGNAFAYGDKVVGTLYYEVETDWPRFASTVTAADNTWWHPTDSEPFEIETTLFTWEEWQNEIDSGPGSDFNEPNDASPAPGYQQGDAPNVSADPSSLDFGGVAVGNSSTETVTISNTGTESLSVTDVTVGGTDAGAFSLASGTSTSFTLSPGASQDVSVVFSPSTTGSKSATLTISSNDPDAPSYDVPLSGDAQAPDQPNIAVNPSSLDFGGVQTGSSATQTLTVTNDGMLDLSVSGMSIAGSNAGAFNLASGTSTSFTLSPGASQDVDVVFSPSTTGSKSATLTISSNDPDTGTLDVPLSGTGLDGESSEEVTYSAPGSSFPIYLGEPVGYSKSVSIGNVDLGDAVSASFTITAHEIDAADEANLYINGTQIPVPDGVIGSGDLLTGTTTIDLSVLRAGTNEVTFETGAPVEDGGAYQFRVDGASINVTYITSSPAIAVDPAALDFGETAIGNTKTRTLTVENTGGADLNVSDLTIGGTDAGAFSLASGTETSFTLAPGATQDVDVNFSPSDGGTKSASLTIASDDPDDATLDVALSGDATTSAQPNLAVDPSSIDYGSVGTGSTTTETVTLTNTGGVDLEVSDLAISGSDAGAFSLASGTETSFTLAPDATRDVGVVFSPSSSGTKTAALTISSNDPDAGTLEVPLSGEAGLSKDQVTYQAADDQFPVYLGEPVGYEQTITVSNVELSDAQQASLTITAYEIDAADEARIFVNGTEIPVPDVLIGDSEQVTGTFAVDVALLKAGTNEITFETGAPVSDGSRFQFRVDAVAITVEYFAPEISTDPESLAFGSVVVGNSSTETLTITNTGGLELKVVDMTIGGTDADDFSLASGTETSFTVSPGASRDVDVVFTPSDRSSKTAVLTIESNSSNAATVDVPLSGKGIAESQQLTYSAPDSDLPLYMGDPVGYNRTLSITGVEMENALSATLTITAEEVDAADEAEIYLNGTEIPVPEGLIGNREVKTATVDVALSLLNDGTNDVKFVTAAPVSDGYPYQYRVDDVSITVVYESSGTTASRSGDTISDVGVGLDEASEPMPEKFTLRGNYPNPFNPVTTIQFDLPEAADVRVEVYDLLGRRVQVAFDGSMSAGADRGVRIEAGRLASGTYLYRMVVRMASETHLETGRMTLVK